MWSGVIFRYVVRSGPCSGNFSPDIPSLPSFFVSVAKMPCSRVIAVSLLASRGVLSLLKSVPTCQGKRMKVTRDISRERRRNCPSSVGKVLERQRAKPMRPPYPSARWKSVAKLWNGAGRMRKTPVKIWPLHARTPPPGSTCFPSLPCPPSLPFTKI